MVFKILKESQSPKNLPKVETVWVSQHLIQTWLRVYLKV